MAVNLFSQLKNFDGTQVWVKRINFGLLIILVCLLIYQGMGRTYVKESSWLVSETPRRDFCSMVASQIVQKNVSRILVEEGLFELITRNNYEALPFSGKEKLSGIWSNDKGCKVILKDELGLRSFDFTLEDSGKYPYYWLVTKIREHELFEKENLE